MSKSICKDNKKKSKVINILVKGLGQVPICDQCAEQLIKNKKMICKNCPSTANYLLNTKLGYEPNCEKCAKNDDTAVMNLLITQKYGEQRICNKYLKFIDSLNAHELDYMGLIDTNILDDSYFIECHENPESQHYFRDLKDYYRPETDPEYGLDFCLYNYSDSDYEPDCNCDSDSD